MADTNIGEVENGLREDLEVNEFHASAAEKSPQPAPSKEGSTTSVDVPTPEKEISYLQGPRLFLVFSAVLVSVFLVNIEVSIVSTSLVTIANTFQSFDETTWVVTAYQVTYTCFHMVWGKIADIFGRKGPLLWSLLIFVIFSGACGASQNIYQLIVFRALQGVGGAGVFLLATVIIYEIVPKQKLPLFGGVAFIGAGVATVFGPLFGGAIDLRGSWRWIFLFNVPAGLFAFAVLTAAMPGDFPYNSPGSSWSSSLPSISLSALDAHRNLSKFLRRLDFLGGTLVLAASIFLVTPLLQASVAFEWSSPTIIVLLVLSGALWILFFAWEWYLSKRHEAGSTSQEPVFPWRFVHNRPFLGVILSSFLLGVPWTVLSIQLPQRFQAVNGVSPFEAGIHLLAYSLGVPIGSFIGNGLAAFTKKPAIIFIFIGSAIQLVGAALLTTISTSADIPHKMYAYEALTGLGVGSVFSMLMLVTPPSVEPRDLATACASFVQFRMLGSTIGVALAGGMVNTYLNNHLSSIVPSSQLSTLLKDLSEISTFPGSTQARIMQTFGNAYNLVLKIVLGVSAAELLSIMFIWRTPQLTLH